MKRFAWLLTAIIIISLASCASPETATPAQPVAQATPVATMVPTPAMPTEPAPTAEPATAVPTKLIPTLAAVSNQTQAKLVIELDQAASQEDVAVYRFVLYDARNFFGVQFDLKFDPALVKVVDSDDGLPGVQIVPGKAFPRGKSFVAINKAEQGLGRLDFAATRVNPMEPLDGTVHVASMSIELQGDASAELSFGQVLLSDDAANSLPVAPTGIVVGNGS